MSESVQTMTGIRPRRRKRHILRKILLWLLALAVLAGAGFYAWLRLRAEYTVTYDSYTAGVGTISNAESFSGSLALIDSATYTAPSDCKVREVYVRTGDTVSAGDKLIRLSGGTTLTADFDGRVNTLSAAAGDEVAAGAELLQLADFDHLKVSIRIDEYDIGKVQVGDACTVTATASEETFESTVAAINYISSSQGNVAYYTGTVYVDAAGRENIYPGMQVTVTVPQEEARDVVVLKMDALSFDFTNSAFVYMRGEDGALTQVPVEVGVSNGNYVEIRSGLSDGDTVYVEAKTETTDAVSGLLAGLFGSQQMNAPQPGQMPGGGNRGDWNGERPSRNSQGGGNP